MTESENGGIGGGISTQSLSEAFSSVGLMPRHLVLGALFQPQQFHSSMTRTMPLLCTGICKAYQQSPTYLVQNCT